MRHNTAVVLAVVFGYAVSGLSTASAQQVSSFEQLQLLVKPGDKIEVVGTDGISTKGKIESLTPAALRLETKAGFRNFAQKDALEIKQRRADSIGNGALIGAVSGAGLMGVVAIAACGTGGGCQGDGGIIVGAIVVYTGIGALIGIGIDALIIHRQTIYRQPPQTALRSLRLEPLLGTGTRGAVLRFSF